MSDYGFKVSKEGVSVKTASNKELLVSSQFDTLKIFRTGTLSVVYPEETLAAMGSSTRTATVNHNLGYYPLVTPFVRQEAAYTDNQDYPPSFPGKAGAYIVNDLADEVIPAGSSWGPGLTAEFCYLEVTTTQLILRLRRFNYDILGDSLKFMQSIPTLYYTIYYNKINEEFSLLT